MPRYFVQSEDILEETIRITGDDFHHIVHVRRTVPGHVIDLCDENGVSYKGIVDDIRDSSLTVRIDASHSAGSEPIDVILCMALLKGKNFELVVQKAVETGVLKIIPFISERTISQPGEKGDKKVEKWSRVASEAAKQSLRSRIPVVDAIRKFDELLDSFPDVDKVIAHPESDMTFKEYLSRPGEPGEKRQWVILIGPEGGFSPDEIREAEKKGWVKLKYGFSQLRAETAGIILPALIIHEAGY